MVEKVTWMVLEVDLQCSACYKKIKKILCKFPQIRDQVYDEQKNLVKITVVCCSPEKIRDKLCCKGGKVIKSIAIIEPPKPKPKDDAKPKEAEKATEKAKPKEAEKATEKAKPKDDGKPKDAEKPKTADKPKDTPKPATDPPKKPDTAPAAPKPPVVPVPVPVIPPPPPPVVPVPVPVIPPPPPPVVPIPAPVPIGFCCPQCFEGHGGGPCYVGYGRPVPPPPCYDNYYYGYGYNSYGKGWHVSRCDDYFSEENSSACRIM